MNIIPQKNDLSSSSIVREFINVGYLSAVEYCMPSYDSISFDLSTDYDLLVWKHRDDILRHYDFRNDNEHLYIVQDDVLNAYLFWSLVFVTGQSSIIVLEKQTGRLINSFILPKSPVHSRIYPILGGRSFVLQNGMAHHYLFKKYDILTKNCCWEAVVGEHIDIRGQIVRENFLYFAGGMSYETHNAIYRLGLEDGSFSKVLECPEVIVDFGVSPSGEYIVTCDRSYLRTWSTKTFTEVSSLECAYRGGGLKVLDRHVVFRSHGGPSGGQFQFHSLNVFGTIEPVSCGQVVAEFS